MSVCKGCKFAKWRMAGTRLHPSGGGRCQYQFVMPPVPASMYWLTFGGGSPRPSGGHISRHDKGMTECPVFEGMGTAA